MPTLVAAHLHSQALLRAIVAGAIGTLWQGLGSYDEDDIEPFVDAAMPIVIAGQRRAVEMTEAFVVRQTKRAVIGMAVAGLTGATVRGGTAMYEVYRRPFVNVWTALDKGESWEAAVASGEARATATAEMDVQLSHRAAYGALQQEIPQIKGFRRAANSGACKFCQKVNGAYVKSASAMPLHNRCGCGLVPIQHDNFTVSKTPEGVSVHNHGELGPMLADPAHEFTGPSDI